MGWISSDHEHEGWAFAVAPDGRLSSSSSAAGMHVQGITGRWPQDPQLDDREIVPGRETIGWRRACDCGWRAESGNGPAPRTRLTAAARTRAARVPRGSMRSRPPSEPGV
jgi:hypothetical protein